MMKCVETAGSYYYHSVDYTYDSINNLTAMVETIKGVTRTTGYSYDDDNRITGMTLPTSSSGKPRAGHLYRERNLPYLESTRPEKRKGEQSMKWLDYREKLGIGFSDKHKVDYFTVKMFNILNSLSTDSNCGCITAREYLDFCNMVGRSVHTNILQNDYPAERFRDVLAVFHDYETHLPSFIAHYMALVNVTDESRYGYWKKKQFIDLLRQNLNESQIPFDIIEDTDGYFVFPKGAEEMDDALVSQTLTWLSSYPKAHTAYVKALKDYSEATPDNASDIADKFRKTLETFFQEFFGCDKTLENCKGLYGSYLKGQNVPSEIAANFETLLQAYTSFMNGYAKHHDKTSLDVLEYIMYQTGNIIRLLVTLRKAKTT